MNLTIKATKTTLTPAIKRMIIEKLGVIERFLKEEDKIHVEVDIEHTKSKGDIARCEVEIHPHGFYAEGEGTDFYEALDLVVPKIKDQLVKKKDRTIATARKQARSVKGK